MSIKATVKEGDPLTPREQQVWDLRRQGYTYLNIASILKITQSTVLTYVSTILRKTGCTTCLELAHKERIHHETETRTFDLAPHPGGLAGARADLVRADPRHRAGG